MLFAILCSVALPGPPLVAQEPSSPVDRRSELQLVADDFGLADGPAWDGRGALYVPDVRKNEIRRLTASKNQWRVVVKGEDRYSATFFSHGRLFASNNSAGRIDAFRGNRVSEGAEVFFAIDQTEKSRRRPNDLVIDHHGGLYFTLTGQNQVVYVSPDGESQVVTDKVVSPNGIILSPDNQTLYVAAYRPKKIMAVSLSAAGTAESVSEFAAMDDGEALGADGMTVDRAGNVYCAGATDVWIWNPEGKLVDRIACPTRPINCAFGDGDFRTLYITGFGGVYKQRMRLTGVPPQPPLDAALLPAKDIPDTSIPESVEAHLDVVYAQYGPRRLLADIFMPRQRTGPLPAVVVVHGGGWQKGDKVKFRALAIDLARRGFVSAAIEYRLANEAKFPAAIHDCNAAVRFLRANAADWSVDPDRIAAVGGSAGGHLVGLMASGWKNPALQGDGGYGDQSSRLQLAIVMAGPLQIATGTVAERSRTARDSNAVVWFGGSVDEKKELYHLADAYEQIDKDTCPIWFLTGELDNPTRNQPARERLQGLGISTGVIVYPGAKHGCWNRQPWFGQISDDIERLLKQHLK